MGMIRPISDGRLDLLVLYCLWWIVALVLGGRWFYMLRSFLSGEVCVGGEVLDRLLLFGSFLEMT